MSLDKFETHLKDPAPGFRCFRCEDREKKLDLLVRVYHTIERRASQNSLVDLLVHLGNDFPEVREFYSKHNGMKIYSNSVANTNGIVFFPIKEWEDYTEVMRERFDFMDGVEETANFFKGVVFGEIHRSANYFVFVTEGPHKGAIYYADHDDVRRKPLAPSFGAFLESIVRDPAQFMYDLGCHIRYSDGKTRSQWIPKEYVSDVRPQQAIEKPS